MKEVPPKVAEVFATRRALQKRCFMHRFLQSQNSQMETAHLSHILYICYTITF